MKRIAAAFFAVFILAAAFPAAGNAVLANELDKFALTGELLLGSRGEAAGVVLTEKSALMHCIELSGEYDAASGRFECSAGWRGDVDVRPETEPEPGVNISSPGMLEAYVAFPGRYYGDNGIFERIREDLLGDSDRNITARVRLNDYTDTLPLQLVCDGVTPAGGLPDASALFPLPLPREVWMTVDVGPDLMGGSPDTVFTSVSGSVYAADGAIYLCFYVKCEGERLDASLLPGGSWGVWRIPCAEGEDGLTADFDAVENVDPLEGEWDEAMLQASPDGKELLLFTAEGGSLWLTVIDTATLSAVQRLELAEEAGASLLTQAKYYGSDDGFALLLERERVVTARFAGGLCSDARDLDLSGLPVGADVNVPENGNTWLVPYRFELAYDGDRLWLLETGDYLSREAAVAMPPYRRLTALEGEETVYCEWLSAQTDATGGVVWINRRTSLEVNA